MKQFEYLIEYKSGSEVVSEGFVVYLDRLGAEGWELAAVIEKTTYAFIWKREKSTQQ